MPRRERLRKLAAWLVVLELATVALFLVALLIGESTQPTMLVLYAPRQPLLVGVIVGGIASWLVPRRNLMIGIHAVALLVVLFPVMGFSVGSSKTSDRAIHLASWNVYFGKLGREQILDEIGDMSADIVLVQASFDSITERTKTRFADRTMHKEDDLVIISKLPIKKILEVPPLNEKMGPKWTGYVVESPHGSFHLYNVHPFSPRHALTGDWEARDNAGYRDLQVDSVVENAKKNGAPFVIIGDTNLPAMSTILRKRVAGLSDAWSDTGFGFGWTFPSKHPWMRIDRAFGSEGVRFLSMRVGGSLRSDHRPIFVDFELTK